MKLLPVDEARARMLGAVTPLEPEPVAIANAAWRVLAEPISASRDQPPFDASAMDGWAVRRADALDEAASLRIAGESAAGRGHEAVVQQGEAVRIFTGAPVPEGADLVVIQEVAERAGDLVRVGPLKDAKPNIRPRGGDFHAGAVLLEAGRRLDPWALSLAAASGLGELMARRRPRVAILATGEELARPGDPAGPWQIYESCSFAVAAQVEQAGGQALRLKAAGDDEAAIRAAVQAEPCDLLVVIGGASVGDYDLVKPALGALGLQMLVASINVRPGKPTWFGRLGEGRLVLGLPGNPASAMACAELFLKPLLLAMQGADPGPHFAAGRLAEPMRAEGPREHYLRCRLTWTAQGLEAAAFSDQDSSLMTVFASADGLMRRLADAPAAAAGDNVEVLILDRR